MLRENGMGVNIFKPGYYNIVAENRISNSCRWIQFQFDILTDENFHHKMLFTVNLFSINIMGNEQNIKWLTFYSADKFSALIRAYLWKSYE